VTKVEPATPAKVEASESVAETETVTETAAQTDYMSGAGKETQR